MTGMDSVDVDARLSVVGAVSTDRRPLYHHEAKDRHVRHGTAYLLDWLSLVRVESLARWEGDPGMDAGARGCGSNVLWRVRMSITTSSSVSMGGNTCLGEVSSTRTEARLSIVDNSLSNLSSAPESKR